MRRALGRMYRFSVSTDPYFVLGVDKHTSFADIKKAYYKLAAQYHPDINKTSSAEKQFILIKESFEKIKMARGESPIMNSEGSMKTEQEYKSVRKNYKDYEDNEGGKEQEQDFKEFYYKTEGLEGEEYDNFRKSFQTINEVQDKKFKPIHMKMPDPSKRFFLGQVMHLKVFSDGSNFYLIAVSVGMFILFSLINGLMYKSVQNKTENVIYGMLNQQVIKDELDDDQLLENVQYKLKRDVEYQEYQKQSKQVKEQSESRRRAIVPIIQSFVTAEDYSDNVL